jgi:serine/threonine protein phosphatase PrpC
MQGWRTTMEDSHICIPNFDDDNMSLFGVFDGHGGKDLVKFIGADVAVYAKRNLPSILKSLPSFKAKDYKTALTESFFEIDRLLQSEEGKLELNDIHAELDIKSSLDLDCTGCTACAVLVTSNGIIVANSGDSRCVLCKSGVAIDLSEDHKPEVECERIRIELAGGFVEDNRINGVVSLTRALGDFYYKKNQHRTTHEQLIIAKPDVRVEKIEKDSEFIIVACDGIWDCMTSQRTVDYIREQIAKHQFIKQKDAKLSKIIERLFDKTIAGNIKANSIGGDNMTCIIARFKHS